MTLAGGYAPDVADTVEINLATLTALLVASGGVVLTGTRGLCKAQLGVRFPLPPLPCPVARRSRQGE